VQSAVFLKVSTYLKSKWQKDLLPAALVLALVRGAARAVRRATPSRAPGQIVRATTTAAATTALERRIATRTTILIVTGVTTTRTRMGAHITITGMGVRDIVQTNRTGQHDDMQGSSGDTLVNG